MVQPAPSNNNRIFWRGSFLIGCPNCYLRNYLQGAVCRSMFHIPNEQNTAMKHRIRGHSTKTEPGRAACLTRRRRAMKTDRLLGQLSSPPRHPPPPRLSMHAVEREHCQRRYAGDLREGVRHGKGVLKLRNGGEYDGQWARGRMDGYGVYIWPDARIYKGQWKAGLRHGEGTVSLPGGERSAVWDQGGL